MGYFSELNREQSDQMGFFEADAPDEPEIDTPAPDGSAHEKEPAPAPSSSEPPPAADDDTTARQAHEAAEAQRKAEWDAAQAKKRAEEKEQLDRIASMNEDVLRLAAVRRIKIDTDKMTNRSMKDSVCAHIQALCEKDLSFARLTMHPRKSMLHCIQYIFRHAQDYLQKELKAGGVKVSGTYGGDVPDGLCFQWAEDYFRDPDAKEDQESDNKFTPRPYIKPYKPKPAEPKPVPKPKGFVDGQISLMGEAS
ncbi:MAG: hypothetical protein HDT20_08040 [Oscillibacter sp.]|nr:hypothetical protein [Oscillibacter sp.]